MPLWGSDLSQAIRCPFWLQGLTVFVWLQRDGSRPPEIKFRRHSVKSFSNGLTCNQSWAQAIFLSCFLFFRNITKETLQSIVSHETGWVVSTNSSALHFSRSYYTKCSPPNATVKHCVFNKTVLPNLFICMTDKLPGVSGRHSQQTLYSQEPQLLIQLMLHLFAGKNSLLQPDTSIPKNSSLRFLAFHIICLPLSAPIPKRTVDCLHLVSFQIAILSFQLLHDKSPICIPGQVLLKSGDQPSQAKSGP